METKLKINEIFESIQGEGKYMGYPAMFIRLSGCNMKCWYCDTKFHNKINFEIAPHELFKKIIDCDHPIVVWTGGEPMLQKKNIIEVIELIPYSHYHHLETNGKIIDIDFFNMFQYVSFSPKDGFVDFYQQINQLYCEWDIKVVTDLENVGIDLIPIATILMPLTTFNKEKDLKISQKVWNYCIKNNIRYSPRIHVDVWGNKRGI